MHRHASMFIVCCQVQASTIVAAVRLFPTESGPVGSLMPKELLLGLAVKNRTPEPLFLRTRRIDGGEFVAAAPRFSSTPAKRRFSLILSYGRLSHKLLPTRQLPPGARCTEGSDA